MAASSDKKSLYMSGIKQVYPTLPFTTSEEICYPFADRSYNINAFPLKHEVRPKKLLKAKF